MFRTLRGALIASTLIAVLSGCSTGVIKSTPTEVIVQIDMLSGYASEKAIRLADAECAKYGNKKARLLNVVESIHFTYDCQ